MASKKELTNLQLLLKGIEERNDDTKVLVRDVLKQSMKVVAKDFPQGELVFSLDDAPQCLLGLNTKQTYHTAKIMKLCFDEEGVIGIMFVYDDVVQKQTMTDFAHLSEWEENLLYALIKKIESAYSTDRLG